MLSSSVCMVSFFTFRYPMWLKFILACDDGVDPFCLFLFLFFGYTFTSSPFILKESYSDRCELIPHFSFDLRFSND